MLVFVLILLCYFYKERGAGADSFSHQATWYQVETRARVILVDIAGFEANRTLLRRSSSLISHSVDHPSGSLTGEHGGLMSWPEEFYKIRHHQNDPEKANEKKNNLSAGAIHPSIFGSMVSPNFFILYHVVHFIHFHQ